MEAQINSIGSFDVRICGLSMEDALKALADAKTPKVHAAFKMAIEAEKARQRGEFGIIDVSPDCAELMYLGARIATMHRYRRDGREFWQGYVPKNGKNVRRSDKMELAQAIAAMHVVVTTEDLL